MNDVMISMAALNRRLIFDPLVNPASHCNCASCKARRAIAIVLFGWLP